MLCNRFNVALVSFGSFSEVFFERVPLCVLEGFINVTTP